mgnify:CR=1 FL=1
MWAFLTGLVTFILLCFKEFFGASARQRKEDEAFNAQELEFTHIAMINLELMKKRAAEEASQAQDIESKIDSDKPDWGEGKK